MLASILSILNKFNKLKTTFEHQENIDVVDEMILAIKKRFAFLFNKFSKQFEKAIISTFLLPKIKSRILDSLAVHVGQIDTEWLFTKIVNANYHLVADLISQRTPAVSILFIKFFLSNLILDKYLKLCFPKVFFNLKPQEFTLSLNH